MKLGTRKSLTLKFNTFERVFDETEISSMIYLYCPKCSTATRYNTFRAPNSSSGRVVTSAKTLTCHVFVPSISSTTGAAAGSIFYSDLDTGSDSATALTNPVYLAGESTITVGFGNSVASSTGATSAVYANFTAPAGKYLGFMGVSANQTCQAFATEA